MVWPMVQVMATEPDSRAAAAVALADAMEKLGRAAASGVKEFGYAAALFFESVYWLVLGRRWRQPVRMPSVVAEMMEIGVRALPIVTVLSVTIGIMLAIQGIHTLRLFGAESRVTVGIALSITREFAPLITGILVAGRSGSALAARLGTMNINQEIDALRVMGINPVRFLVAPSLVAMMIMVPLLTFWSDFVGLLGAGLYVGFDLGMSLGAYADEVLDAISVGDLTHGLGKSVIFAALITLVAAVNGASVSGGAEGVGRATTRAVVQAIAGILITDMLFVFIVTR
jgi:phospholipid/cholesterol/gamma-HCH transport system permease protein